MRWGNLLYALVIAIILITIALLVNFALHDGKIGLLHEDKVEVIFVKNLPWLDFCVAILCMLTVELIWIYGLLQLLWLARHFRQGRIFDEDNAQRLIRLSGALAAISVVEPMTPPILAYAFYWSGVTPWLSELPILRLIEPSHILASIFFFVLGKVMSRAVEMEKESRLYV
jgi:hypothetical protein